MRRSAIWIVMGCLCAGCGGGGGGGAPGGATGNGFLTLAGGGLNEEAYGIATFADGSCVVTGLFSGTCTWGAGQPGQTSHTAAGATDVFLARYAPTGALQWVKRAGGILIDVGVAVDTLPDESCIVVGRFQDVATFGPGEPNATVLDDVDDQGDVFVARYDADGTLAWAKRAGRDFSDRPTAVAAHPDGSCVVTGTYDTIAVFGPGEAKQTVLHAAGGMDVFVAAYHPNGALAWAVSAGGGFSDEGTGIDILADGSSLVTGYYDSVGATFGPGEPNQTFVPSAGILDAFVARYNVDGTLAWVRRAGGPSFDEPQAISALADGGFVIGGFFRGTAVFGPGEAHQTTLTSLYESNDIFLARHASDGSLLWVVQAGGMGHGDAIRGLDVRADGSCAVTGQFEGLAVFERDGPGETFCFTEGEVDTFVARFHPDGRLEWLRTGGGPGSDRGYSVAFHGDGSVAACGLLRAPAVFNAGRPDETFVVGAGNEDAYIARYDAAGGL